MSGLLFFEIICFSIDFYSQFIYVSFTRFSIIKAICAFIDFRK